MKDILERCLDWVAGICPAAFDNGCPKLTTARNAHEQPGTLAETDGFLGQNTGREGVMAVRCTSPHAGETMRPKPRNERLESLYRPLAVSSRGRPLSGEPDDERWHRMHSLHATGCCKGLFVSHTSRKSTHVMLSAMNNEITKPTLGRARRRELTASL